MKNNKNRKGTGQYIPNRQKVYDVIEESTTNKRQKHMAGNTTHLTGGLAFPSYLFPAEALK